MIATIIQRNQRFYYQYVAELNQHYLNVEIEYFKIYEIAQQETRKVKHDMKNHMYVLKELLEEERYQEAKIYLEPLTHQVDNIKRILTSGNEAVDAILNVKNEKAQKSGNEILIEGTLNPKIQMASIDLCTIFANALDNAIEELERYGAKGEQIEVQILGQNHIQMLIFRNTTFTKEKKRRTKKKDWQYHGFGMNNIKEVVNKYQGDIKVEIEEKETLKYVLEIIIPFTTK
ncbi:MAG: GHKL domain-containing protein [Cellulosilyticum sp.]|nr:GHKL domain-containing protein [Cellulosilyticum sp.]